MTKTLELAKESGDLALVRRLESLKPTDQVACLGLLILENCAEPELLKDASGDLLDRYAQRMSLLVSLVLAAKEDEFVLPAIAKLDPGVVCDHERFAKKAIGDSWLLELCKLALEIEKTLPKPPKRSRREYLHPGPVSYHHPVYAGTRLLIYDCLLSAWSQIHDDKEATKVFASFLELTWSEYPDKGVLEHLKQKLENLPATSYRLEEAMTLILSKVIGVHGLDALEFLLRVLKHRWVKQIDQNRLAALVKISHELPEQASAKAWLILEQEAEGIYQMDRIAAALISALSGLHGHESWRWSVGNLIRQRGNSGFIHIDYSAANYLRAHEMKEAVMKTLESSWWNNPENPDAKRAEIFFDFSVRDERGEVKYRTNYRYHPVS